jgi:hypothetical protein
MQKSLALKDATDVSDHQGNPIALGKGLRLVFDSVHEGRAMLYRGDYRIKTVDLGDKVAKKLFITEIIDLGANQSRLANALGVSRQTLHNYQEVKKHFGVQGLIDGYRMTDGTDVKQQRAQHTKQRAQGNKAQQVAAIRAEDKARNAVFQETLNFSFGEKGRAGEVERSAHPFAKEHGWEASRYTGCFVYWPTLMARWRWLELVMGHFGAGWRIFAVFLLMAGLDIRSIEQLKNVRSQEAARVLGLARMPAKTQIWEWFYAVARQGLARELLADYCRYQIQAGLVSVWIWFTDGHLLPYTGKEKLHYSYNTQRRMPVPGRTNQVTCDGSGRIVDFEIHEGKGAMKQWILEVVDRWCTHMPAPPVAVFDREGYDAGFFFRLVSDGRPFVSWEKNVDTQRLAAIDAKRFATDFTFNGKRYSVFEQPKTFSYTPDEQGEQGETHTFTLRHIHIWNHSSNRRTCALVHADASVLSLEEATRAILSRWGASENTFKHLQERHPAHYQPGFKLLESENQEIANPDIKTLDKRIGRLRKELDKLYKKLTKTRKSTNKDGSVRRNSRHQRLQEKIESKEQELNERREDKSRLPERVDVSTLQNYRSFKQVDNEGKYLFDFVTASVWNARKQMVDWLRADYRHDNEVVDLFYAITHCHGWVRSTADAVTVRLEPLPQPKRRAAQEQFCRKLTSLGAQTPLGKRIAVEVGDSPL